jgi:hypothetical protein
MEFRVSVLLSLQRALWDLVGPNLRGVAATFDYPVVTARFLFENDPTEEDLEDVSLAETHTIADFPEDVSVDFVGSELGVARSPPGRGLGLPTEGAVGPHATSWIRCLTSTTVAARAPVSCYVFRGRVTPSPPP